MTRSRWWILVAVLLSLSRAQVPGESPGPPVRASAPTFALPDQDGHSRDLRSLNGPKGLMLVFFRSADW
jgi:hypothetical protein